MDGTMVEAIVRSLKAEGVTHLFGLPGGEVIDLIDAARREGIPFHLTRHEAAAAYMADVVAQLTGRPAACVATVGPGAANLVPGIAHAYLDRAPVLALTGCTTRSQEAVYTHQTIDQRALFRPITKWTADVTPAEAQAIVRKAVRTALSGRPGPVHLDVPLESALQPSAFDPGLPPVGRPNAGAAPWPAVAGAAGLLAAAERPVIIAGQGCLWDGVTDHVVLLAETTGAPVMTTPKAKGVMPEGHPLFLGVAGLGMIMDPFLLQVLREADLVVAAGYEPVEVVRGWLRAWGLGKPTLHIDRLPNVDEYYRAAVELVGDVKGNLEALLPLLTDRRPVWAGRNWAGERRAALAEVTRPAAGSGLSPAAVIQSIHMAVPPTAHVAVDVGAHKILASQLWPAAAPNRFFVSNGLSIMGFGLSAAIAAKLVHPQAPALAIVGDGGFAMAMHEVETAVRLGLGVILCVLNDQELALIKLKQEKKSYPPAATDFGGADYAGIGRAMGAAGETIATPGELERALRDALRREGPTVLDIRVNPAEYRRQM